MKTFFLPRIASLAAGALAVIITQSACAQDAKPAAPADADSAWRDLQNAVRPPPPPSEWQGKQPTAEQIAEYKAMQSKQAAEAADLAKAFYTKYPTHPQATEARRQQGRMLQYSVNLGNTNKVADLQAYQDERLKDPNLSEDERYSLRQDQLTRDIPRDGTDREKLMAEFEKVARQLAKEFPKRKEPFGMLLSIATNVDDDQARKLLKEISESDAPEDIKGQAKALVAKFDRVGKPLALKFKSVDDKEVSLESLKGKVVLVDFWATWCGPCVKEIPNVRAAYEKLHPKGFEIVGISFDSDKDKLTKFTEKEKMTWPQYFDGKGWGNEFGKEFGINSIPAMWLVDKKGNLRDLNGRSDLEAKVEKMLAE